MRLPGPISNIMCFFHSKWFTFLLSYGSERGLSAPCTLSSSDPGPGRPLLLVLFNIMAYSATYSLQRRQYVPRQIVPSVSTAILSSMPLKFFLLLPPNSGSHIHEPTVLLNRLPWSSSMSLTRNLGKTSYLFIKMNTSSSPCQWSLQPEPDQTRPDLVYTYGKHVRRRSVAAQTTSPRIAASGNLTNGLIPGLLAPRRDSHGLDTIGQYVQYLELTTIYRLFRPLSPPL
jgi:hypothetical protein